MASALARKPLPKPSPESDPRFRKVMEQLKAGASKTKSHPPAAKKAAEAAAAAKGPPNERAAGGKAKQVDKIKDAPSKKPEPNSFLAMLRAEIEKAMPKTLGETEHFDDKAQQMKGGLKGNVSQQKEQAAGGVAGASREQPGNAGEAKVSTPVPPEGAAPPPAVSGGEGMPAPKSDGDVSLQDSKQDTDQQMKDAEVSPQQLQKANDPRFSAVLDAKTQVARQADAGPAQFRAAERTTLTGAAAGAQNAARQGAAAMVGVRRGSGTRVLTRQQQQQQRDEAKRREVVAHIEQIFNDTKARVEQKLTSLDTEVGAMFDQGTDAALAAMTSYVDRRILRYKLDRYLSIPVVGAARWIRDQFVGLPDEVNVFYNEGRELFRARMDALIVRVANLVESRLKEAKNEVARGQAEIKKYVESQPKELQGVAQQAQRDVASRFEELEHSIDDKKNQLAQSLAAKYKEAFDKANEALKKIQDDNKGLVQAFAEKLGEVIKALIEFKNKLMAILRKGADAIKLILDDPIKFLSNLIAAVKGGISAFVANIWTHLKKGFMTWLFGALAGAGIEIPGDLSLPSILKLVLSVLGITYDRMRAKAVRLIGERNVRIIEKLVEYIRALITGGPAALWEKVKEDLSTLKQMVIDAIQNWLIETIVKQAVAKIVSMFNPVGAIVQAILAIYNMVMFVVEKAQQIMAFLEAVVNSISAIANGAIGGAIAWIEQALANSIPIVIGFLARLIGLGGISQKIKDFITKVQAKVDAAIDKAIAKVVAFVKRMFGGGKDKNESRTEEEKKRDLHKAVEEARAGARSAHGLKALKPRLTQIKSKYKLTKLKAKGGSSPTAVTLTAIINPEETGDASTQPPDTKTLVPKADDELSKATAAATQVKTVTAAEIASMSGDEYADLRRSQLAQRPGSVALPTRESHIRPSTASEPHGIDVALLTSTGAPSVAGSTLEFTEVKKRGQLEVFVPVRSSAGTGVAGTPVTIQAAPRGSGTSGSASANRLLGDEPLMRDVMTGQASLLQQGRDKKLRKLENKLSSLTTAFASGVRKMLDYMRQVQNDPAITDEVKAAVQGILNNEGGIMKFVIDVREGVRIGSRELPLAKRMIELAFESYMAGRGTVKTQLQVVLRKVDASGKAEEITL